MVYCFKKKKQFIYNNIQIPILYIFTEFGLVSKLTSLGNQSKFIQPFLHIKKTKSHACSKTPLTQSLPLKEGIILH